MQQDRPGLAWFGVFWCQTNHWIAHRALLADVSHSRGCGAAAGVDVLSAEEVMMVAWVVDAQVRMKYRTNATSC